MAEENFEDIEEYLMVDLYSYPEHKKLFTVPFKFRTTSSFPSLGISHKLMQVLDFLFLEPYNAEVINIYLKGRQEQIGTFVIDGVSRSQYINFKNFENTKEIQDYLNYQIRMFLNAKILQLDGGAKSPKKNKSLKKRRSISHYTKTIMAWRKKLSKRDYPSITDVAAYVKNNNIYIAKSAKSQLRRVR
jgi:hypothetical protein